MENSNELERLIQHTYRPERRARHIPSRRVIQYEHLVNGEWKIDYTTHENVMESSYFRKFYKGPEETL
jgi:hypothetical protein